MPSKGKYPDELRDRAARMVLEQKREYGSQWEAISSFADTLGTKPETFRLWVRPPDDGQRSPARRDDGGVGGAEAVEA